MEAVNALNEVEISLKFELSEEEKEKVISYAKLVELWNTHINLTSAKTISEIIKIHIKDSLVVLKTIVFTGKKCFDIGAGAGFPGLPIAIVTPDAEFTLIESKLKKAAFLKSAVASLGLKNVQVFMGRAEALDRAGYFDLGLSRATGETSKVWQFSKRLLKVGGKLIYWKGKETQEEDMKRIFFRDGKITEVHKVQLADPIREIKFFIIERTD